MGLSRRLHRHDEKVHTRAYLLDETTGRWESKGTVVEGGFWPLGEPQRMADGNWIMAGFRAGAGNPAAVAISHGDDLTKWDLVVIPLAKDLGEVWGESAVIVEGKRVTSIARWGKEAQALVAVSEDYGRTWTPSQPSNLPMTTSKPCAGTLSTGQRFLDLLHQRRRRQASLAPDHRREQAGRDTVLESLRHPPRRVSQWSG